MAKRQTKIDVYIKRNFNPAILNKAISSSDALKRVPLIYKLMFISKAKSIFSIKHHQMIQIHYTVHLPYMKMSEWNEGMNYCMKCEGLSHPATSLALKSGVLVGIDPMMDRFAKPGHMRNRSILIPRSPV